MTESNCAQMTQLIIYGNALLLVILLLIIIYTALGTFSRPFSYVSFHFIFRLGEFLFEVAVLWMAKKITPDPKSVENTPSTEMSNNISTSNMNST